MKELEVSVTRLIRPEDIKESFCCMTEVVTPWPEALRTCREWLARNLGMYVEGYHLELEGREVVGHLYYALSEKALIPYHVEPGIGVIYCEWVQRRYQERGFGRRLYNTFLEEMEKEGVKGILVEATDIEGQMHFEHYLSRGFKVLQTQGHRKLLFHALGAQEVEVEPIPARIPRTHHDKIEVLIINGFACPFEISTQVILQEMMPEFGDRVHFTQVWLTPETLQEYGVARGIFINGREKLRGGEPEEAVRKVLMEEL